MAATLCTYSLPSHAPHAPLTPLPSHFHSAAEILRAQHALDTENEKLAHKEESAKAIIEAKNKLALMKTQNAARLCWSDLPQLQVPHNSLTSPDLSSSSKLDIPTISLDPMERHRQSKAERNSKIGKHSCKAKTFSQAKSQTTTTPLLKSKSSSEVASAFNLQLTRATSTTSASKIQQILLPHLFSQVAEHDARANAGEEPPVVDA
jgi:hypothetical protein